MRIQHWRSGSLTSLLCCPFLAYPFHPQPDLMMQDYDGSSSQQSKFQTRGKDEGGKGHTSQLGRPFLSKPKPNFFQNCITWSHLTREETGKGSLL